MADGPRPHIIRQGDTLLRVAVMFGVGVDDIKNCSKNSKMAPYFDEAMLPAGEVLYVPRPKAPSLSVASHNSNKFKATIPIQTVVIAFEDEKGPLRGETYKLHDLEPEPKEGALDGSGVLRIDVPLFVEKLRIVFEKRFIEHTIWVGHLEPREEEPGVQARLLHLGYLPVGQRVGDPFTFSNQDAQAETVKVFQSAFGLEPTGFADEATRKKLVDKHGC